MEVGRKWVGSESEAVHKWKTRDLQAQGTHTLQFPTSNNQHILKIVTFEILVYPILISIAYNRLLSII